MMRIHIQNGRIIDPKNNLDELQDIFIADGLIIGLKDKPDGFQADLSIAADNALVLPGIIDLSARLNILNSTGKHQFETELHAANSSGVTCVVYPPDTYNVTDNEAAVELIMQSACKAACAHIYPLAKLTTGMQNQRLTEMATLKQAGCIAAGNGFMQIQNMKTMRHALEYAKDCQLPVFIFAEDQDLSDHGVAHEGAVSTKLGLPAISELAETVALARILLLVEKIGTRVHFSHISTAHGVKLIADAKDRGMPVTADTTICHLHLNENDVLNYNSNCHLRPPLRSVYDQQALIQAVEQGVIDAVCSAHTPLNDAAKSQAFSATVPGASTIEHLFPLMLSLVKQDKISIQRAVAALSSDVASILNLELGALGVGSVADLFVVHPEMTRTVSTETLLSAGKNTPFDNWRLHGHVSHTLFKGQVVYHNKLN